MGGLEKEVVAPAPGKKKTAASWLRKGGSAAGRDAEAEEADGGNGASEIKREREREEKRMVTLGLDESTEKASICPSSDDASHVGGPYTRPTSIER
uniref:Uncharacterized protein n=1 Tax=Vespula pensylvanica TaxID=30213 RepID=A0A834NX50_VESPE|nr:hypothetical protein H0235_010480 [Vespula pensylvanica]